MQQAEGRTDYTMTFNTAGLQSLLDLVGAIIDLDGVSVGNIKLGALPDNLFAAIGGEAEVGLSITGGVLSNVSAAVRNNGSDLVTLNAAPFLSPQAQKNSLRQLENKWLEIYCKSIDKAIYAAYNVIEHLKKCSNKRGQVIWKSK